MVNDYKPNVVFVQERFSVVVSNETDATKWVVGLTYTTESEKNFGNVSPKLWLIDNMNIWPILNGSEWYIFNLQSIGSAHIY
jgi:hypothetical protein